MPVRLVLFPVLGGDSWGEYPYGDLHRKVALQAESAGFAVLDLLDRLPERAARPIDLQLPNNPHPTAEGHRICAEEIAEFLAIEFPDVLGGERSSSLHARSR